MPRKVRKWDGALVLVSMECGHTKRELGTVTVWKRRLEAGTAFCETCYRFQRITSVKGAQL